MKKLIYLSIVLLVVSLFLISIGFSAPTLKKNHQEQLQQNELKSFTKSSRLEDKSINQIINKGYKKLIDGLKLKSQFHYDEEKYMKRAMEKQSNDPLGYKCQHDSIMEKRNEKLKSTESLKNKNGLKSNKVNLPLLQNAVNLEAATAKVAAVNPSAPIRFKFDTSYITGTTDKYACYSVGQLVVTGDAQPDTTVKCVPSGEISPCVHTCTIEDVQSTELQNFFKSYVIETIKDVFESRLKVRNPQNSFKFNPLVSSEKVCDYGVSIPNSYYTTGIQDTDIYVWVTARPTPSNNTIAYAFACNFDTNQNVYGRPTAASINFNPYYFTPFIGAENSISFNEYVRVGIHEMTHALGFSASFFDSYVEPNTYNVVRDGDGAASSIKFSGTTPNGQSWTIDKYAIFSDNVVSFAKGHYGCSDLKYQELEDYGGQGTAGSHWEARTAGEEYMIGFVSPTMPITDLSFSLLQDSGWYEVNDTASEPMVWGKGLGCKFVQEQCSADTWNFQGYYCTDPLAQSCTGTRMGKGVCHLVTGKKDWLPEYQHFDDPKLVGVNLAADGCPFYQVENNNVYCFDTSKQSTANSDVYETYCENCRCFEYQETDSKINQACWEQRCVDEGLQIKIANDWVSCPDSQTITSNNVTIVCPRGYAVCGGEPETIVVTGNAVSIIFPTFLLSTFLLVFTFLYSI